MTGESCPRCLRGFRSSDEQVQCGWGPCTSACHPRCCVWFCNDVCAALSAAAQHAAAAETEELLAEETLAGGAGGEAAAGGGGAAPDTDAAADAGDKEPSIEQLISSRAQAVSAKKVAEQECERLGQALKAAEEQAAQADARARAANDRLTAAREEQDRQGVRRRRQAEKAAAAGARARAVAVRQLNVESTHLACLRWLAVRTKARGPAARPFGVGLNDPSGPMTTFKFRRDGATYAGLRRKCVDWLADRRSAAGRRGRRWRAGTCSRTRRSRRGRWRPSSSRSDKT